MSDPTIQTPKDTIETWVAEAYRKVDAGTFGHTDIDRLLALHRASHRRIRQRLLYVHAGNPSIYAELIAAAIHEPVSGAITEIDPMVSDMPYKSVHEAVVDGWRIIHFPHQQAFFDDREIDVIGYEFILEKMEAYDD